MSTFVLAQILQASEENKETQKSYSSSTSFSFLLTSGNTSDRSLGIDTEQNWKSKKNHFQFKGSIIYAESEGSKDTEFYYSHIQNRAEFKSKAYILGIHVVSQEKLCYYNLKNSGTKMNLFGTHNIPLILKHDDIFLSIEKEGKNYLYKREANGQNVEKLILGKKKQLLIHPIEPVNKPKTITPYLLIKFKRSIIIEAKISKIAYLKFPIELGVFLSIKKNQNTIDIFTLTSPKYTLYGDPRSGVICKYYESDIHSSPPNVYVLQEGILELNLLNRSPEWTEVKKVVLDAHSMHIYYNHDMAFMRAEMEVQTPTAAETGCIDSPYSDEMEKSMQLFLPKKLPMGTNRFMMREGF